MGIFDVIGPVMVGPSSSHTVGAMRIGLLARRLLGMSPDDELIPRAGQLTQEWGLAYRFEEDRGDVHPKSGLGLRHGRRGPGGDDGGNPRLVESAVAFALGNVLGLICDPVLGLVEIPCVKRNALGAINAVAAAEMVLSGCGSVFTADGVVETMEKVGRRLPEESRETARGGLALLPMAADRPLPWGGKGTLRPVY